MGSVSWIACSCALLAADPSTAQPTAAQSNVAQVSAAPSSPAQPAAMVLNFTAPWCGPCQSMSPMVTQLEAEGLPIRKINIDREPALMRHFGVTSIPAFVLVIDGRPAERLVGRQDESTLRSLLTKATTHRDRNRVPELPHAEGLLTVQTPAGTATSQTGEVRTASLDAASSPEVEPALASASGKRVSKGFSLPGFGGSRNKAVPTRPAVLRGNASEVAAPAIESSPFASTVRIRVADPKGENFGTGTVIDSRTGRTLVLTCGHIFRNLGPSHRIVVEVFTDQSGDTCESYVGKVIKYDLEADCGLISIPAEGLAVSPVAKSGSGLVKGTPVLSIGCGGGNRPTVHQMRVTALNRYLGPDNIECDDLPVEGRSGGGLFTKSGQLIGVCTAADKKEKRGLYCGLKPLHKLLDQCGLGSLYRPGGEAPSFEDNQSVLASTSGDSEAGDEQLADQSSADAPLEDSAPDHLAAGQLDAGQSDAGDATQEMGEDELAELVQSAGPAEVVCVIRPIDRPRDATRVVVINRASPRFLSYLSGEVDLQSGVQKTALQKPKSLPLADAANVSVPDEFVSGAPSGQTATAREPATTGYRRTARR
jgi:thiol-disulfide isomerase/thioredoxin